MDKDLKMLHRLIKFADKEIEEQNKITEILCIRTVLLNIKSVIKLLIIIPNITGTVTTKNIFKAIDSIAISLLNSLTPNSSADVKMIKGTVRMLRILTMAVKLTDKATSPLANFVNTFEVTPPGAAAITITPKAISIGIGIILIKIKAIIGSKITWQRKPTKKSLGNLTTRKKSLTFKPKPRPSMMMARAIGANVFAISIAYNLKFEFFI